MEEIGDSMKSTRLSLLLVGLCVGIIFPLSASAVTWNLDATGQLLGAGDVLVGDFYYDVAFVGGCCMADERVASWVPLVHLLECCSSSFVVGSCDF